MALQSDIELRWFVLSYGRELPCLIYLIIAYSMLGFPSDSESAFLM